MKLKKLTMCAFGSYAEETVIDFTKLGESGLYLITGETGSGKTTIFDAIIYALYGGASGSMREKKNFRSAYASDKTKTFVELTFECGGKEYIVNRTIKKSGEDVSLKKPDGSIITKIDPVNDAVEEIIGINRAQFAQTVMLPQNEFGKALSAKTKEREEIFRYIFDTGLFKAFSDRISAESSGAKREYERLISSLCQYLGELNVPEEMKFEFESVRSLSQSKDETEEFVEKVAKLREEAAAERKKEFDEASKEKEKADAAVTEANAYVVKQSELTEELKKAEAAANAVKEAEKKLSELSEEEEKITQKRSEIAKLENDMPQYDALGKSLTELTAAEAELDGKKKTRETLTQNHTAKTEELNKKKAGLEALSGADDMKRSVEDKKRKLSEESKLLSDIKKAVSAYRKTESELAAQQKLSAEAIKKSTEANEKYTHLNNVFLCSQAGIMARDLQEGMPCPVCGSTSHPALAVLSEDAPSESDVRNAKKEADRLSDNANRESSKCAVLAENKKIYSETAEKLIALEWDGASVEDAEKKLPGEISRNAAELEECEKELAEAEEKLAKISRISELIPELEKEIAELADSKNALENEISALSATIASNREHYEKEKAALRFESRDAAEKEQKKLICEVGDYDNRLRLANSQKSENESAAKIHSEKAAEIKKELDGRDEPDMQALRDKAEALAVKCRELDEIRITAETEKTAAAKVLSNVRKTASEYDIARQKYMMINKLSNAYNGVTGEKTELESYAQAAYFERVLRRGNIRLMKMTNGQFELTRKTENDNKKSKSGLDIEIIDHHNGSHRVISTFSGGEGFKASLALCCGLSEEIQSRAGGIRLDTMFIDEGFGSLDDDSRELALSVLNELAGGNRQIGIISHVADFKNRIDKKIVVTKNHNGISSAKIECE